MHFIFHHADQNTAIISIVSVRGRQHSNHSRHNRQPCTLCPHHHPRSRSATCHPPFVRVFSLLQSPTFLRRANVAADDTVRADVHFSSPSQAAAFATDHSCNGWAQWKTRWAINRRLPPASKLFFAALAVIVRHGMAISSRASHA